MAEVELLLDCRASIGESPTWFAPDSALYWIDVKEPALHRLSADGLRRRWSFDADIGAFALLHDGAAAIVALRNGLFQVDLDTGTTNRVAEAPFDQTLFRFNEGICDLRGRFWVGVMLDPIGGAAARSAAAPLHRFTFEDGLVAAPDRSDLHNGFAWNADATAFYWSHSNDRQLFRAPYDVAAGTIGQPDVFAAIRTEGHLPDGCAMDEEGCYWCAIHGGGVLHRYDPVGRLILQVTLPVSQPTMCAFIGETLDEMVVTSAREKLGPDQLAREPHAGGLFRFRPGVRGLPRPCMMH